MSGLIFSFEKRVMIFAMTTPPAVPTQNAQHRDGDGGLDGLSADGGTGRGGGFFAHRAFAVVRVVLKVAIDGYIKIFSLESWARQKMGEGHPRCFLMGVGRVARRPRFARVMG